MLLRFDVFFVLLIRHTVLTRDWQVKNPLLTLACCWHVYLFGYNTFCWITSVIASLHHRGYELIPSRQAPSGYVVYSWYIAGNYVTSPFNADTCSSTPSALIFVLINRSTLNLDLCFRYRYVYVVVEMILTHQPIHSHKPISFAI